MHAFQQNGSYSIRLAFRPAPSDRVSPSPTRLGMGTYRELLGDHPILNKNTIFQDHPRLNDQNTGYVKSVPNYSSKPFNSMKIPVYLCALLLVFTACRKDKEQIVEIPEPVEKTYEFPSDSGTYWVYEWFNVDSLGISTPVSLTDTLRITGDTTISGKEYVVYSGTKYGVPYTSYERDSSGFIVSPTGVIRHAISLTTDTLSRGEQGLLEYYRTVNPTIIYKSVPYGTYKVIQNQIHWSNLDGSPFNVCGDQEFIQYAYYDQYLGEIASQSLLLAEVVELCSYRERRLVDYYHP